MSGYQLSKSSYIRGMQCLKSVYLNKYFSKHRDPLPEARMVRFQKGHDIGLMARRIFPGGIDVSPDHPGNYHFSALKTQSLISRKEAVIYEAAFIYNNVLAAVDMLVYNNGWHAYEIKSSENISKSYIEDAALQYYVITGSGLPLKDFSIIHLKVHYRNINPDDSLENLFRFTSLTNECINRLDEINIGVNEIKKVLASPSVPSIKRGNQCHTPYECDFYGWCTKQEESINEGLFNSDVH